MSIIRGKLHAEKEIIPEKIRTIKSSVKSDLEDKSVRKTDLKVHTYTVTLNAFLSRKKENQEAV